MASEMALGCLQEDTADSSTAEHGMVGRKTDSELGNLRKTFNYVQHGVCSWIVTEWLCLLYRYMRFRRREGYKI